MKLTGIKDLYYDMKAQNMNICQFEFTYSRLDFDIIFKIDCEPYILMFGIKLNNEYFEIKMKEGFEIEAIFDKDVYNMLIKLFEISDKVWEPFRPIHFFNALNTSIPKKLKKQNEYRPSTYARYRQEFDEDDKIYFVGWICHDEFR